MVGVNPKKRKHHRKGYKVRHYVSKRRNPFGLGELAIAANPKRRGGGGGPRGIMGIDWMSLLIGGGALVGNLYALKYVPPNLKTGALKYAALIGLPILARVVIRGRIGNALMVGGLSAAVLHFANDTLAKGGILSPAIAAGTTAGLGSYETRGLGATEQDRAVEEVVRALGAGTSQDIELGDVGADIPLGAAAADDEAETSDVGSYESAAGLGEQRFRVY